MTDGFVIDEVRWPDPDVAAVTWWFDDESRGHTGERSVRVTCRVVDYDCPGSGAPIYEVEIEDGQPDLPADVMDAVREEIVGLAGDHFRDYDESLKT